MYLQFSRCNDQFVALEISFTLDRFKLICISSKFIYLNIDIVHTKLCSLNNKYASNVPSFLYTQDVNDVFKKEEAKILYT